MDEVYILYGVEFREGFEVLGVYTSKEKAQQAKREFDGLDTPYDLGFQISKITLNKTLYTGFYKFMNN